VAKVCRAGEEALRLRALAVTVNSMTDSALRLEDRLALGQSIASKA
jgi:hypothetical protein